MNGWDVDAVGGKVEFTGNCDRLIAESKQQAWADLRADIQKAVDAAPDVVAYRRVKERAAEAAGKVEEAEVDLREMEAERDRLGQSGYDDAVAQLVAQADKVQAAERKLAACKSVAASLRAEADRLKDEAVRAAAGAEGGVWTATIRRVLGDRDAALNDALEAAGPALARVVQAAAAATAFEADPNRPGWSPSDESRRFARQLVAG